MTDFDPQAGRELPANPQLGSQQGDSDELELQAGLSGLAGLVSGCHQLEHALAQVATLAAHAIPGATGASVSLLRLQDGTQLVQTWSATADFVTEIDRIQYELVNEGPCLTCVHTGRPVLSGSLSSDQRWPRFGGRVARLGVHSALSLPLRVAGDVIGAINCYATDHDAFTEHAVRLGEQFAGPAAVAVHNAQLLAGARSKADQLRSALNSRAVIDQAIGILRSRAGGSATEAFARLRQLSQAEDLTLSVVAQRLVDDAVRRAQGRHFNG